MSDETTSQKISALAEKAIEAEVAYTQNPEPMWRHNLDLLDAHQKAEKAFRAIATPEAWLALRNEVLEEFMRAVRGVQLEAPNHMDHYALSRIEYALNRQRPA